LHRFFDRRSLIRRPLLVNRVASSLRTSILIRHPGASAMILTHWLRLFAQRLRLSAGVGRSPALRPRRRPAGLVSRIELLEDRRLLSAVAVDDTNSCSVGSTASGNVLANDSGDNLQASVLEGPQNGSVELHADGSYTYTPNAGYRGTDSFSYQIVEQASGSGEGSSASATVTIGVGSGSGEGSESGSGEGSAEGSESGSGSGSASGSGNGSGSGSGSGSSTGSGSAEGSGSADGSQTGSGDGSSGGSGAGSGNGSASGDGNGSDTGDGGSGNGGSGTGEGGSDDGGDGDPNGDGGSGDGGSNAGGSSGQGDPNDADGDGHPDDLPPGEDPPGGGSSSGGGETPQDPNPPTPPDPPPPPVDIPGDEDDEEEDPEPPEFTGYATLSSGSVTHAQEPDVYTVNNVQSDLPYGQAASGLLTLLSDDPQATFTMINAGLGGFWGITAGGMLYLDYSRVSGPITELLQPGDVFTLTVQVTNTEQLFDTATVIINIAGERSELRAVADSITFENNSSSGNPGRLILASELTGNDYGWEGATPSVIIGPAPSAGTLTQEGTGWRYTAAAGFTGAATFLYRLYVASTGDYSDWGTVTVNVIPNEPPQLAQPVYARKVNYSAAEGDEVLDIDLATQSVASDSAPVVFSILGGGADLPFEINATTGQILVRADATWSEGQVYTFQVVASDGTPEGTSPASTVTLTIGSKPRFVPATTLELLLDASDVNRGAFGWTLSLEQPDDGEQITGVGQGFVVTAGDPFVVEQLLRVEVVNNSVILSLDPARRPAGAASLLFMDGATISIEVQDEDGIARRTVRFSAVTNEPPRFAQSTYTIYVPPDVQNGFVIGSIAVDDPNIPFGDHFISTSLGIAGVGAALVPSSTQGVPGAVIELTVTDYLLLLDSLTVSGSSGVGGSLAATDSFYATGSTSVRLLESDDGDIDDLKQEMHNFLMTWRNMVGEITDQLREIASQAITQVAEVQEAANESHVGGVSTGFEFASIVLGSMDGAAGAAVGLAGIAGTWWTQTHVGASFDQMEMLNQSNLAYQRALGRYDTIKSEEDAGIEAYADAIATLPATHQLALLRTYYEELKQRRPESTTTWVYPTNHQIAAQTALDHVHNRGGKLVWKYVVHHDEFGVVIEEYWKLYDEHRTGNDALVDWLALQGVYGEAGPRPQW
jgi:hypothetical protein